MIRKMTQDLRFSQRWLWRVLSSEMWHLPPAYLLVLAEIFFDPENGGDMFLRNVDCISTAYTRHIPEDDTLQKWRTSEEATLRNSLL
jgi:hypothetical protein